MGYDDDPPIRFRPEIRLFRQDGLASPEPLISQVRDEFAVRPDLPPVPPVAEAQEAIAAMFEEGQAENQVLNSLGRKHREQYRQLLLWCGGNRGSCTLAEVYQRTATSPWLVRSTRAKVKRDEQWVALGSLAVAFPPGSSGADFELSLHCACTPTAVTTSPGELIRRAVHEPGTYVVTE